MSKQLCLFNEDPDEIFLGFTWKDGEMGICGKEVKRSTLGYFYKWCRRVFGKDIEVHAWKKSEYEEWLS